MNKGMLQLMILLTLVSNWAHAQCDTIENNILRNDRIKFNVIFVSPSATNLKKPAVSGRYVSIDIPKACENSLLREDSVFWISHLENESEDWATNLVLYYIFQKDATEIAYFFDTREKWLKIRSDEIKYWKKRFKRK